MSADDAGRIKVNEVYQSEVPNIYAAGDVIGFPSLASTSMEQGRHRRVSRFRRRSEARARAVSRTASTRFRRFRSSGQNEEELTEKGVPYEIGKAQYREIARGQIVGDTTGMLKLLSIARPASCSACTSSARARCELVHIGQAVLALKGKIDYFVDTVFNYPTLAECYKNAAFDGINRLQM